MIRVGRIVYDKNYKQIIPTYENFKTIIVMTKSSAYGSLGPYCLKNKKGQLMENIFQASKIYTEPPKSVQRFSRYDQTIIWDHSKETHLDENNKPTAEYWEWRNKLYNNEYPVRYPVGFQHRTKCVGAIWNMLDDGDGLANDEEFPVTEFLDYVESRKKIYVPVYCNLVKEEAQFADLKTMLLAGQNLLICEVDGPHQEDLQYYKDKYDVNDDFIEGSTMLVNKKNIRIMINDPKRSFGHGYCLALALLDKEHDWIYSNYEKNVYMAECITRDCLKTEKLFRKITKKQKKKDKVIVV